MGVLLCDRLQQFNRLLECSTFLVENLEGVANQLNGVLVKATPFQTDSIDAASFRWSSTDDDEGRNVIADVSHATDHGVSAYLEKLIDPCVAAQYRPVAHFHMPGEADVVG